ncbi:MAG: hypothetical protein D6719_02960 [Candidatus Dadabacteria bacterium]|nr:MAG: hypothetical protein D6719_02960 [Candidatus Dadabacteria bacterium]
MKVDTGTALAKSLARNLSQPDGAAKAASRVGNKLGKIEDKLLKLYTAPEKLSPDEQKQWLRDNGINDKHYKFKTIEGARAGLQIMYQRAQRAYQAFFQIMRSMHEMMMALIRNLRP